MLLATFAKYLKGGDINIEAFLDELLHDHSQFNLYWFWSEPRGDRLLRVPGSACETVDLPEEDVVSLAKKAVEGEWQCFEYAHNNAPSCGWSSKIDLGDRAFSTILLFGGEGFDFDRELRDRLTFALVAIGMVWSSRDLQSHILDMQQHIRFQAIWAEAQEWIKRVYEDNDEFYLELLIRAELVTQSTASAIRISVRREDAVGEDLATENRLQTTDYWLYRKTHQDCVEAVAEKLGHDRVMTPREVCRFNDLDMDLVSPGGNPVRHLMVYPVNGDSKQSSCVIYVLKTEKEPGYSQLDEILISQLITQVFYGLEKNILLRRLESRHRELDAERKEQEKLIQKLKDTTSKLVQSEKLASIGQLAAGVAHEINNPVGYVSSNISTLSEYIDSMFSLLDDIKTSVKNDGDKSEHLQAHISELEERYEADYIRDDVRDLIAESKDGIHRVRQIIQSLKDFSRPDTGEYTIADLHRNIDQTLNIVHNELKHRVVVVKEYGDIPEIEMVESQIGQVILNLLVNAGHAIEKEGQIVIRTSQEGDFVCMAVEDNGQGISQDNLEKLFDPFFTTKPVGQGTGLGLALSYGIVNKHHGRIEVDSQPGKGSTFMVYLPIVQPKKG
ncbi:ATP-binding protein [Hahella ganghwensis]|uniref:ATP-binding protein n=1 Tax=Hahella ganghwensis TaxID=286420 RepID=UPI000367679A|nr:ATP-binding protein [Hahella ganghwensis]